VYGSIVQRFFTEGARVAIADRDTGAAAALAKELSRDAFSVPCDVTDQNSIEADYVVAQTYGVDGGNWMA
jgi:NAD(P)-dependent dehydrogenase (short-subunit alcohol dehydrogenase family)